MIYESSKDHGTGAILMLFDGEPPSQTEIDEYLTENYGIGVTGTVEVEPPSVFRGMHNPGTIAINP